MGEMPGEITVDATQFVEAVESLAEALTTMADACLFVSSQIRFPMRAVNVIDDPKSTAARLLGGADDPTGHRFEAGEGSSGMVCTRMVMRDGGGDACGATPDEHRLRHA